MRACGLVGALSPRVRHAWALLVRDASGAPATSLAIAPWGVLGMVVVKLVILLLSFAAELRSPDAAVNAERRTVPVTALRQQGLRFYQPLVCAFRCA